MRATREDVHRICLSLPGVELGISWGDRPTYKVLGRGFVLERAPRRDAIDPATGEPYDDLLVIQVPDAGVKAALVEDPATPFFTIPHFDGWDAVLVQTSRLGELEVGVLEEVLTEAWAARAPARLVREHLGG